MSRILAVLSIALAAAGCSGTEQLFLTQAEAQALEVNFEAALEAQQLFSEYSFRVARGDADISGYLYDPPTSLNNWVGTLVMPSATLPFGTGSGTIVFRTTADGVPVDPYATDISGAAAVAVEILDAEFTGVSVSGAPLALDAAFDMDTVANAAETATTVVNGAFTVVHGGYEVFLDATDVTMDLDLLAEEITSMTGAIDGTVDIPNFAFDGNFDVEGLGTQIRVDIDVVATSLDYFLDLSDLF